MTTSLINYPDSASQKLASPRLIHRRHRLLLAGLLAVSLPACLQGGGDDMAATTADPLRYTGVNNLPPYVLDTDPLKRSTTDNFGLTSSGSSPIADPLRLCQNDPGSDNLCTLKTEWNNWRLADSANRNHMLKGIAKCAMASGFEIVAPDNSARWGGIWGLFPEWKTARLQGPAKRERLSSCILSLLNGNNVELNLCLIGPGSPYNEPCSDPNLNIREGGFFGDLFAAQPKAYVAGPDTAEPATNGRACFGSSGVYCCAENDSSCTHRVVLAGSILGNPATNYDNKRCNSALVDAGGGLLYCPSFYSTREPGRTYSNVFTSFIPPAN